MLLRQRSPVLAIRFLSCCVLLLGGDDFAAGTRAFQERRFADALAAFTAAESAAGEAATAALFYDKALAALCAGRTSEAESAADQAAARGGGEFVALRDFLRGNLALARCDAATKQVGRVESEPFAFDAAIALAEAARDAWQAAAMSRQDWPQARRNAERAVQRVAQLQAQKALAQDKKDKARKEPAAKPPPPPPPAGKANDDKPATDELAPEQVRRILDKLAAKEREKIRLRASVQRVQSADVQRDW